MRRGPRSRSRRGAACSFRDEERDRLADTLRLAEALGGEALTIPGVGRRIADDVISFAQANNVTQIVIGKSTRSRWFEIAARLGRARSGAPLRQYQRSRHCRRRARGRAGAEDGGADGGTGRAVRSASLSDGARRSSRSASAVGG